MLTHYHCWVFENCKIESVEVLREWVIQEAKFQTKAVEVVQGMTGRVETRSNNTRGSGLSHTFFGRSNLGGIAELQAGNWSCKVCNKQHGVWACSEFKKLEKYQKGGILLRKLKLCFRCLCECHLGQHCYRTRVCGLNGCQEIHHRLLHKVENKNSDAFVSEHTLSKGEGGKCQQEKNVNKSQSTISHEVPAPPMRGNLRNK